MYSLIKFFLFLLPPEKAHDVALNLMQIAFKWPIIGNLLRRSFKVENPNAVKACGCGSSFSVEDDEAGKTNTGGCGSCKF